jgi:hypothetical protein
MCGNRLWQERKADRLPFLPKKWRSMAIDGYMAFCVALVALSFFLIQIILSISTTFMLNMVYHT